MTEKIGKSHSRIHKEEIPIMSVQTQYESSKEFLNSGIEKWLTEKEKKIMIELLDEYKDLFSLDIWSTTPFLTHKIYTDGPPKKQRAYWTPLSQKAFVSKYPLGTV